MQMKLFDSILQAFGKIDLAQKRMIYSGLTLLPTNTMSAVPEV